MYDMHDMYVNVICEWVWVGDMIALLALALRQELKQHAEESHSAEIMAGFPETAENDTKTTRKRHENDKGSRMAPITVIHW